MANLNELKPEDVMKENDFLVRGISKEQLAEERVQALREGYQATLRKNDALIAKLEAYIDELNEDKSYLVGQIADLQQMVLKKNAEIERLKGALKAEERHNELTMEMAKKALANARSDAITEFAERLKAKKCHYTETENTFDFDGVTVEDIEEIAKEMKEVLK